MFHSIRTKLLVVVCISYILSTTAIVGFGIFITKQIITSENEEAYTHQLEVILRTLQKRHEKLTDSGMAGLFADGYKKSTAKDLGDLYYAYNQRQYPVIVDTNGLIVLHPTLAPGSAEVATQDFIRKMLLGKNGTLQYRWRSDEKWMVFRTFEPWQWTVGYAITAKDKYASVQEVVRHLAVIMALSSLLGLVVIYYMLRRIVRPITVLAEDARIIGGGHYEHQVAEGNGRDEVARLAASFSLMAKNISERDNEIRRFNEQLEQRVQQRTAALEQSEKRFRDVALSSADWIWELDHDGRYTYSSGRVKEILGYDHDEIIGKRAYELMSQEEAIRMRGIFKEAGLRKQAIVDLENRNLTKEGKSVYLLKNGLPIFSKTGELLGYRGVDKDITKQKHYEEELKLAKESAEAATQAKSEFLANMSHEIRTPMNGVIGMTGLLLDTELSQEQREYAEVVRKSGESLLQIINEILDFSKIEAGKLDLETIDFDLRTTVEDVADTLAITAHEKGLELPCLFNNDVPAFLRGDPGRLRQIIINLANNAIKFTEKGEVAIHVSLEKEVESHVTARFAVSDTGIGIPKERLDRLFKSFSQVDASHTRKYGGSGLGLALSKKLCEMMEGQIGVETEENKGSTFWFTVVLEKQPRQQKSDMIVSESIQRKHILIVDDNKTNRFVFKEMLKSWDCRFDEASSGKQALEKLNLAQAESDPFEIAILDMQMPEMDGEALGQKIKQHGDHKNTILVMLTSMGQRGDVARLKKIGFAGYLNKPVKSSDLYNCLVTVVGIKTKSPNCKELKVVTRHTTKENQKREVRILLAEDNEINQQVAINILKKLGYRTDVAANGREAIKALEEISYDLVLMDVQMPEMDGFQATRIIRDPHSNVRNHQVPVIAMTANAMKEDRQRCLNIGMDDYTSKPIDPKELLEKIEKWTSVDNEI